MKQIKAMSVVVGIALSLVAHAEMVYETQQAPAVEVQSREDSRDVVAVSEKAKSRVEPESIEPETVEVSSEEEAPSLVPDNLTRAELLRRKRMRNELKNEDLLQERLEELRLRDEEKRTKEILKAQIEADKKNTEKKEQPEEEAVVATVQPQVETVGDAVVQPPGVQAVTLPATDQVVVSQAAATPVAEVSQEAKELSSDEPLGLYVTPRGGLSNFLGNTGFDVVGRFAAGITVGMMATSHLGIELGYLYSEYGVRAYTGNPSINFSAQFGGNGETMALKQNSVDLGLKLFLLSPDSKFRPFVGGSLGYSKSYVNYDVRFQNFGSYFNDYEVDQFLGALMAGFDVRVSRWISVGAQFKYNGILTARQHTAYNPFGGVGGVDFNTQAVGASLSRAGFYSATVGATFSF